MLTPGRRGRMFIGYGRRGNACKEIRTYRSDHAAPWFIFQM